MSYLRPDGGWLHDKQTKLADMLEANEWAAAKGNNPTYSPAEIEAVKAQIERGIA